MEQDAAPAGSASSSRTLGRPRVTVRAPLRGLCLEWLDGGEGERGESFALRGGKTTPPRRRKHGAEDRNRRGGAPGGERAHKARLRPGAGKWEAPRLPARRSV